MTPARPGKPYKQAPPEETVARLRGILDEVGITTVEIDERDRHTFHSSRVETVDLMYPQLRMGANGKGMTRAYSSASAHAELLERLQNGNLAHPSHLHVTSEAYFRAYPGAARRRAALAQRAPLTSFHADPREVMLPVGEAVSRCSASLSGLLRTHDPVAQRSVLEERLGLQEVLCVPFYDPARREEVLVPIRLLEIECASNGMCAGNTPHEALVQGVCELFERHALTRIFLEQPRLPEIPRAYFGDAEIVARIARLEAAEGWRVTVKDCSLGMGVPIVGALIHDPSSGSCAFHIGVAPSPATALERCLTEIFQTGLSSRLLPVDLSDDPLARALARGDLSVIGHHVAQYFRTGAVRFPLSILDAPEGVAFDGAAWEEGADDAEDLAILLRRVEALGRRLLVRDVSFLGFPAYWAYIPGMSESHLLDLDELVGWYKLSNDHILTWNDLAGASTAELRAFAETAARYLEAPLSGRRNPDALLFGGQAALGRSRFGKWLPYVFLRLGDRPRAAALLHGGGVGPEDRPVAERCLSSGLALAASGLDAAAVEELLRQHFAELDVQAAMLWLTDPELAFHQLELPACFACESCPYLSRCGFIGTAHVVAAVKARHEAQPAGCDDLASVFDGLCPDGGTGDD